MTRRAALAAILSAAVLVLVGFQLGHADSHTTSSSPSNIAWVPVGTSSSLSGEGRAPSSGMAEPGSSGSAGGGVPPAPTVAPTSRPAQSGRLARATFYCDPPRWPRCTTGYPASCLCAAASPDLHLQGKVITVAYEGRSVRVRVIDCDCQAHNALDLYASIWEALGIPLSRGVVTITYWP